MKRTSLLIYLIFCLHLSGCGEKKVSVNSPAKTVSTLTPAPSATLSRPANGDYPGKGKITKINNELGSVELDHEEIEGLMPRMIMEFYLEDKKMIGGLAVGDNTDFVVRYKDGTEIIVEIKKVK